MPRSLRFQHACNGELPENAVVACKDGDGNNLYVARAYGSERPGVAYPEKYKGFLNPGVMQAGCSGVYIAWVGKQILEEEYEILVQDILVEPAELSYPSPESGNVVEVENVHWVHACNGELPSGASALMTGHRHDGAPLFAARGKVNGCMAVGKMVPKHGKAYLAYDGKEHGATEYEVLCVEGGRCGGEPVIDMTPSP